MVRQPAGGTPIRGGRHHHPRFAWIRMGGARVSGLRIVIAGGPKVGKTTAAFAMKEKEDLAAVSATYPPSQPQVTRLRHTDDLIGTHEWSESSADVSRWFDEPGPWIIEGVAAVRALRKWLERVPSGRPCDVVHWSSRARVTRSAKQDSMAKSCETIWESVRPELMLRGVVVRYF